MSKIITNISVKKNISFATGKLLVFCYIHLENTGKISIFENLSI